MSASESARHLDLKRLALTWAQGHGYSIAGAEVSFLGVRVDAAAFRPAPRGRRKQPGDAVAGIGTTVIFECKQSRADFLKDSRSATQLAARLAKLHQRRALYEESMRPHWATLRNGETLFPEFDSYRFETVGYEPYDKLVRELRTLSARLHAQTKFAKLIRWRAANLHYVVAEEGVAKPHELPHGWGLLVRAGDALTVAVEPTWQDATEEARLGIFLRIAQVGTRAVNRSLGVELPVKVKTR